MSAKRRVLPSTWPRASCIQRSDALRAPSPCADWIFLTICLAIAGGIFWLAKGQAVQKSLDAQAQGLKVSAAAACAARR
jgi:hypothetical protein